MEETLLYGNIRLLAPLARRVIMTISTTGLGVLSVKAMCWARWLGGARLFDSK